ncbi:MAG TPA: ferredoxin [Thermoanaerobaculia bacterium]
MADTVERNLSGLRIVIDRGTCIGSRNCIKLAPEVFALDAEGIVAFRENAPDIDRGRLVEACDVCPVDALQVIDPDETQIVP